MKDEYAFLTNKEILELDDKAKLEYIESLKKIIDDLDIMAEKNCSECETYHLDPGDLNIEMLFEDWRSCAENCDNCGKEEKINMCDLQFQLMSFIADEVGSLRNRINGVVKMLLRKDDVGKKLVANMSKARNASNNPAEGLYG